MSGILAGLGALCQPMTLLALFGGVVVGLIVGSLPGLNDSITMAVLIPVTFGMEPGTAIGLLVGIYCASACGGSVPSILLKIPGTASATVTAYDGYPMSKKGRAARPWVTPSPPPPLAASPVPLCCCSSPPSWLARRCGSARRSTLCWRCWV